MKKSKKILFIGRGSLSVNCLNILKEKKLLPKIIICDIEDNGKDTWTRSLYKRATELGYKEGKNLLRQRKVNDNKFIERIKKISDIDIILSVQPYAIFKKEFISLANNFVVNLHLAPLPKLRGVAPAAWAIMDNFDEMGVTLHLIEDEGIDNGPVIAQKFFSLKGNETTWDIFLSSINNATKLFEVTINNIALGNIHPEEQNEEEATYHNKTELDFSKTKINIYQESKKVYDEIRAKIFPPHQLPFIVSDKNKIYIKKVSIKTKKQNKKKPVINYKNKKYKIDYGNRQIEIVDYIIDK